MQQQKELIRAKWAEVCALSLSKFGVSLADVNVRFDLKGRSAGQAQRRGTTYNVRFNADMLTREAFDHVLNNTVPHEAAHIVCFKNPSLGNNHDHGWVRVCRGLGGSAARTHTEDVIYGKGYTYEYTTTAGHKVRIGDKHHAAVRAGRPLTFRNGKGVVNATCLYSIVGHQGRSYATPVARSPLPAPNMHTPVVQPVVQAAPVYTPAPMHRAPAPVISRVIAPVVRALPEGTSKAATSRALMLAGHRRGDSYETVIAAMMAMCGYNRQLARATYKANFPKLGIPMINNG